MATSGLRQYGVHPSATAASEGGAVIYWAPKTAVQLPRSQCSCVQAPARACSCLGMPHYMQRIACDRRCAKRPAKPALATAATAPATRRLLPPRPRSAFAHLLQSTPSLLPRPFLAVGLAPPQRTTAEVDAVVREFHEALARSSDMAVSSCCILAAFCIASVEADQSLLWHGSTPCELLLIVCIQPSTAAACSLSPGRSSHLSPFYRLPLLPAAAISSSAAA